MSRKKRGDHDEYQKNHKRQNHQEIRIETNKRIYKKEGPRLRWSTPVQDSHQSGLELKHNADSKPLSLDREKREQRGEMMEWLDD